MRRFVYSPKVWAYVKTGKTVKSIRDVSQYIVSGSVQRNLNAISPATLTIRNPRRMWTGTPGNPVFKPQDPITIYMMRSPGHPVQTFTGFLDRTPYYQMYPGTVTLRASCTLKRLLYTYFDPALPFTLQFMAQYGWVPDGQTGMMINIPAELPTLASTGYFTDSGIGSLLFATLNHIGNWNERDIYIERLPGDLPTKLASIFNQFRDDNTTAIKDFQTFLDKYIGPGSYGTTNTGEIDVHGNDNEEKAFNFLRDKGLTDNQSAGVCGVMKYESQFNTTIVNPTSGAYGIAQWLGTRKDNLMQKANYDTIKVQLNFLWSELQGSESASLTAIKQAQTIEAAVLAWLYKFERPGPGEEHIPERNAYAHEIYNKYANRSSSAVAGASVAADSGTSQESSGGANSNTSKIYAPIAGHVIYGRGWHESSKGVIGQTTTSGHLHWHSGVDAGVPAGTPCVAPVDGVITFVSANWSDGGMVHFKFTQDVGSIQKGTVIGWGHVQKIFVSVGDEVKGGQTVALSGSPAGGPHVHFIERQGDDGTGDGSVDPLPLLQALMKGKDTPTDGGTGGGGGGAAADPSGNAKAAAFVGAFSAPSAMEMAEALLFQGQKSLMNDKPLFPFVEQLSSASLRQFQSLPDGRFFAFFPDYFGEFGHSKPYWNIRDIEILDGTVELNDDELVTHEFVVGDTIPFGGIGLPERLLSSGVVTVFNAFDVGGNDNKQMVKTFGGKKGKEEALDFLKRYGARPEYHEAPMIRSPYFELLLAWQRFQLAWSRQFNTEFTFTFMPELYPGGKVGFPDHGIKMFIESVTHSFDYTGGFTTTATLTAPSHYGSGDVQLIPQS